VPAKINKPSDAIAQGIAFVTEDRKHEGLILPLPISLNAVLATFRKAAKGGLLNRRFETAAAQAARDELQIKLGSLDDPVSSLSGGNQQKVVLAKWLNTKPGLLLLDEPTRGVDVGAKAEIYAILRNLAENGAAILLVSSELPELMRLSDRILVLSNHEIAGELARHEFSEEAILRLAYGQNQLKQVANDDK
jgi:ribose transport system ATP-binding protein